VHDHAQDSGRRSPSTHVILAAALALAGGTASIVGTDADPVSAAGNHDHAVVPETLSRDNDHRSSEARGLHTSAASALAISGTGTYREGGLVYARVNFTDPDGRASGFGFEGVGGAGWGRENHPFSDPSFGRISPGQVDYPFNLACDSPEQYESDIRMWIYGDDITTEPVTIHLACTTEAAGPPAGPADGPGSPTDPADVAGSPTTPAGGRQLYSADWSSGPNGWAAGTSWRTLRGALISDGSGSASTVFAPYDTRTIPDYAVEARIRLIRSDDFGIVLRHSASDAGYVAGLSGDGAWLGSGSDAYNAYYKKISPVKAFDPGSDWHTYRVEADGNTLRFLIDGAEYATATDNRYISGGIAGLSSHESQIEVSSFTVSRLG
jgi:hypothetical protein